MKNAARGETRVHRETEQQAGGQAAKTNDGVVETERGAARADGREVGNPRFLDAFGQAEVQAVGRETRSR